MTTRLRSLPLIGLLCLLAVTTIPARMGEAQAAKPKLALEVVTSGLQSPLGVVDPEDGTKRLFIVEQGGTIRILERGRVQKEPFLDLTSLTQEAGERGLLGLAFHPRYDKNGLFYVYYTATTTGTVTIAEYKVDGKDPNRADPDSARTLLEIIHPVVNHNGGSIVFGPDGFLYLGIGDGGGAGDPEFDAQRLDNLLGKQLRIDVDNPGGGREYGIPEDNPFVGTPGAQPEIWAYGLRNPWRFSFDRKTGHMWLADVGQNRLEEVNRAEPDQGGINYGWNIMEGNDCFPTMTDCRTNPLTQGFHMPLAVYDHDAGCSVTGGYVYRGREFPQLYGLYLFADYCTGLIWSVEAAGPDQQEPQLLLEAPHSFSSFGEDSKGRLYATDLGGVLLKVIAQ
ncbi:MAG: sorbosone dehydrogenase family protein [Actinomycetota bacterium]